MQNFGWKLEGKTPFGRPTPGWKIILKLIFKEIGLEDVIGLN
jgi:hypothetical protein